MPFPLVLGLVAVGGAAILGSQKKAPVAQIAPGAIPQTSPAPTPSAVPKSAPGASVRLPKLSAEQAYMALCKLADSPAPYFKVAGSVHDLLHESFGASERMHVFRASQLMRPGYITAYTGKGDSGFILLGTTLAQRGMDAGDEIKAQEGRFWPWNTANDKPNYCSLKQTGNYDDADPLVVSDKIAGMVRLTDNGWVRAFGWKRRMELYVPYGFKDIRWPLESGWQQALEVGLGIGGGVLASFGGFIALAFAEGAHMDPNAGTAGQIFQAASLL